MAKLIDLEDLKMLKAINQLPRKYSLVITREGDIVTDVDDWQEHIRWHVKEPALDTKIGDGLIFNHMLTIVSCLIDSDESYKEHFKDFIMHDLRWEVIDHDSNFNK